MSILLIEINIFLKQVFLDLKENDVDFCFLRQGTNLWDGDGDIDILLNAIDISKAIHEFSSLILEKKWFISYNERKGYHHHIFISKYNKINDKIITIHVDFQTAIYEGNKVFILANEALNNIEFKDELPCLSSNYEAALLIIRSVVGKGYFKPGYWEFIKTINYDSQNSFQRILRKILNNQLADIIIKSIENDRAAKVLSMKTQIIRLGRVSEYVKDSFPVRILKIIARYYRPPGYVIINETNFKQNDLVLINALSDLPFEIIKYSNMDTRILKKVMNFISMYKVLSKNGIVIINKINYTI